MTRLLALLHTTQRDWDSPCLFDSHTGTWLSRGELAHEVGRLAANLASLQRNLVFCYCANDISSILSYLACLLAGQPVLLLNSRSSTETRAELERRYHPELILEAEGRGLQQRPDYLPPVGLGRGISLIRRAHSDHPTPHPNLALLLTTSGSTGSPKLVRLSLANLEANAQSIAQSLDLGPSERAITSLPLYYSFGLSVLNSHLWSGGSLVVTGTSPLERSFWKLFNQKRCTSFAGVPFLYHLLERIKFDRMDLPSLRTMTQAGGRLALEVIQRFHELLSQRGQRLMVMYGQTEATARIACLPPQDFPRKRGSVGLALKDGSLTIQSENGQLLPSCTEGEIVYHGPNVMMGYASTRDDLTRGDEQHGRLATGDLGYLDDEGYLFVTGRLRRFSKLFGLRINLDDVENLLAHRGPTAVVGNDEKLLIFCCHGSEVDFQVYGRELAAKLKVPNQVFKFHRIEALPLTASGKIDYKSLETAL